MAHVTTSKSHIVCWGVVVVVMERRGGSGKVGWGRWVTSTGVTSRESGGGELRSGDDERRGGEEGYYGVEWCFDEL